MSVFSFKSGSCDGKAEICGEDHLVLSLGCKEWGPPLIWEHLSQKELEQGVVATIPATPNLSTITVQDSLHTGDFVA